MPLNTWKTFEGKIVNLYSIDHQHLSNVYWFDKIFDNAGNFDMEEVMKRFELEFNNIILPYRPHIKFKLEIKALELLGCLKVINYNLIEVWFKGELIGQIEQEPLKIG